MEQHTTDERHLTRIPWLRERQFVPLAEGQMLGLASVLQEIHANRNLLAFLEEVWGHMEHIDTIALFGEAHMGSEEIHGIEVRDEQDRLLLPDLTLLFWVRVFTQERDDAAVMLEQDLEECGSDESRLEIINQYLRSQDVFKEMGLPDPKDESSFYQRKTRLSSVSITYPAIFREQGDSDLPSQRDAGAMREHHAWPWDLDAGVRVKKAFAHDLQEIYNRWAEFPANMLYRVARYLAEVKEARITLPPEGHVCYLWKTQENDEGDQQERYLIELEFRDELLLLKLLVPAESIPLERVNLFGNEVDIPVHRVDAPLPDHPASAWFMEIVRALETPPLLAMTAQVSQEIASEWIWGVCEELGEALETIAHARGDSFPRPLTELEAEHVRLGKRLKKMAASTGMTQLNLQAEIVCLAAQILLQRYTPDDDLQMPWMILLNPFGQGDHVTPILAARTKVAYLVAHPELARLPNDMGFSLRGPMHAVGMAIREAIRFGVYQ
jgi:hypothetical protein